RSCCGEPGLHDANEPASDRDRARTPGRRRPEEPGSCSPRARTAQATRSRWGPSRDLGAVRANGAGLSRAAGQGLFDLTPILGEMLLDALALGGAEFLTCRQSCEHVRVVVAKGRR